MRIFLRDPDTAGRPFRNRRPVGQASLLTCCPVPDALVVVCVCVDDELVAVVPPVPPLSPPSLSWREGGAGGGEVWTGGVEPTEDMLM